MGQTLENGVYLPSEGERNCYAGLKTNWEILDQKVADVTALQQAVAGALHRQIVASLPTTDIDPNTIYMVLSGTSATENVYNEFMYVNNAWELIGTSATDLTNYYTKVEVDGKLLLKANDSDVVHKSGDETIAGVKTFSDDTYITSLNFTNNVASPSSSASSTMPIINTITYTSGDTSVVARLNFRITADGVKSLYPNENNQYLLGLQSRKWKEIHATEYYYGSSDVEFSTKFVTTDTAQDVTANKNFKGLITTLPDSPLWTVNTNTTGDITSLASTCIHVESRAAGSLTDLSGGAWYVAQIGTGCFFFRQNRGTDIRYKHFPTNVVSKICVMSNDNKFISDLVPDITNAYNLGNSSFKWSTINGLNPSSLGMPDLNNGIDISSYISYGADRYDSTYTVPDNGYITIYGTCGGTASGMIITNGHYAQSSYAVRRSDLVFYAGVTLPVSAGDVVTISTNNVTSLINAKFYPCQGNV